MNKDTKGNHLEPSEDSLLLPPPPLNINHINDEFVFFIIF